MNKEHGYIKTDNEQTHVCVFPLQSPYFHSQNISVIIATGLRVGILRSRILVTEACETTAEYSLQWKQLSCVTADGGKQLSCVTADGGKQLNCVTADGGKQLSCVTADGGNTGRAVTRPAGQV